jgi:predicted nucleotidyltransferase
MKEWRALEEKRERAWEVYMSTSSSDIDEASIANKESKESIGTD